MNSVNIQPVEHIQDHCDKEEYAVLATSHKPPHDLQIVWRNVILFFILHLTAVYGIYLAIFSAKWQTNAFAYIVAYMSIHYGAASGVHRLWTHRSYKAKMPLRILLAFLFTIAFQNDIYVWVRDHRVHHKYADTDADPHNIKRGFFFAHIGWLLCRKHPEVSQKGNTIDLSDVLSDPVVKFQRKYYSFLVLVCCFIFPTIVPMFFWDESFKNAFFIAVMLRYCVGLNVIWLINSAAHYYGNRPYDDKIESRETNFLIYSGCGEGWHNFHHTFPYDYAASENGSKWNSPAMFIDFMALLGLAYDRKTASKTAINNKKLRSGNKTNN